MGFTIAGAALELAWDLRAPDGAPSQAGYIDTPGVVPEPSQAKLDAYADAMVGVYSDLGLDIKATATQADIEEAMEAKIADELEGVSMVDARRKLEERFHAPIRERRIKATVAVCGGKPTAKELRDLPPRYRDLFLGWVAGWAMDPTQGSSG